MRLLVKGLVRLASVFLVTLVLALAGLWLQSMRLLPDAAVLPPEKGQHATCFAHNSPGWLQGPRHGNARDSNETEDSVRIMLLGLPQMLDPESDYMEHLLSESLALKTSLFLNYRSDTDIDDLPTVRRWAVRLIYLAIHKHQHEPALAEAKSRANKNPEDCEAERKRFQLGPYDYECPDTNYLVTRMWNNGLGANMEAVAVASIMAGVATNRTVLFVNQAPPTSFRPLTPPWPLASCHRRDFQCFFQPLSPCVLTVEQLAPANVYALNRTEKTRLFANGELPGGHENDQVIYFHPVQKVKRWRFGGKVETALRRIVQSLIDALAASQDPRRPLLRRAADAILESDDDETGNNGRYQQDRQGITNWSTSKIAHGILFYLLRPHATRRKELDDMLLLATTGVVDRTSVIGMPVRASDKCIAESECLSFAQNVQAVQQFHQKQQLDQSFAREPSMQRRAEIPSIIFTTESKAMISAYRNYSNNGRINFITNPNDVAIDTGRLAKVNFSSFLRTNSNDNMTADQAMLLALSSLQLQLLPSTAVLNCCSNFHKLIHAYLLEGLGASTTPVSLHCLQDSPDPTLRICCGRAGPRNPCWRQRQEEINNSKAANSTNNM